MFLIWNSAQTAAQSQVAYGATGYLATITSSAENSFVSGRLTGDGWIGASDAAVEGTWQWVTGPEAGTTVWQGPGGGNTGGGNYANWNGGEPNQSGDEDCAETYVSSGRWNDLSCSQLLGYVLEFGASGNMPTVVAVNISIITADVPTITSLTPPNGTMSVSPTSTLQIGFSKSVSAQTGTVLIKKVSDNSTVEAIDVTGVGISGSGSNTITITPSAALPQGTELYVTVPGTAFRDGLGNYFDGIAASTTWRFTVADITAPVISNIATSTASTTATIGWNTNELASSKVTYGLTEAYGTSTVVQDVSPRVTVHSVMLSGLLACTMYHYAVVSSDASANTATSSDRTVMTSGCAADSQPQAATSTAFMANTGGSTQVNADGKTFTVTAPTGLTATSSSYVIQVKAISGSDVLTTLGRPNDAPYEVGNTVFNVTAIINNSTILDSFDAEVTISYQYTDDEINGLNESSLWLYHYTGGAWAPLHSCTVSTSAHTVTCTTPSFSMFALFGNKVAVVQTGGHRSSQVHYGCKDPQALNYDYFSSHKQELCTYATSHAAASPSTTATTTATSVQQSYIAGRDLSYGMTGEDVRLLQRLLNANGFVLAADGPGSSGNETEYFGSRTRAALSAYQTQHGISPTRGYFGSRTRKQMMDTNITGIWWSMPID